MIPTTIFLMLFAHGHLQFMMPMPNPDTCRISWMVAKEMMTKDKKVGARAGCFNTATQAFYQFPEEEPPTPDEERVD